MTDRVVPVSVFSSAPELQIRFIKQWTGQQIDPSDLSSVLEILVDWSYYIQRLSNAIQKIITIPAAFQRVSNPVPRVQHPGLFLRYSFLLR